VSKLTQLAEHVFSFSAWGLYGNAIIANPTTPPTTPAATAPAFVWEGALDGTDVGNVVTVTKVFVAEEAEDVAEAEVKDTMLYVEYGVWFGPAGNTTCQSSLRMNTQCFKLLVK
jgi:hypothetical protein